MLSAALFLLANSLFLTLRLTGDTGSFPKPLSAGEERMYLERSLAGDLEARNILVEHNLRLVAHIIKKYYTQAAEQEDLISIGTIGLIKAVDTFRPERKIRLATYASRCVENEVLMYFRSRKKLQGEVSLSDTIEPDAAGGALSLMDVVGCDDTMLSDMADREERLRIRELVGRCLTDREAEVIRRRYGLSGRLPQTQRQVAAAFGISRSYVSRRAYCKHPKRLGLMLKIVSAAKNDRPIINSTCLYFDYKKFQYLTIIYKNIALFCCKRKFFQIFIQNFVFSYCILIYILLYFVLTLNRVLGLSHRDKLFAAFTAAPSGQRRIIPGSTYYNESFVKKGLECSQHGAGGAGGAAGCGPGGRPAGGAEYICRPFRLHGAYLSHRLPALCQERGPAGPPGGGSHHLHAQ